MKKLLITGFEPFGGDCVNPSWMAVEKLPEQIGHFILRKKQLPTVYGQAAKLVLEECAAFSPDVIICVGVAANRAAVTPERIGVNIRDARIADNAGNCPQGDFVVPGAPPAYFATIPFEAITQAIQNANIPAAISNSAGTFVCNDTLYTLLHHFNGTKTQVGFIHVPALAEQANTGLPLEQIVAALTTAITACQ